MKAKSFSERPEFLKPLNAAVLCSVSLCASIFCFYAAIPVLWYAHESKKWLKTTGRVLESRVKEGCDDRSKYSNCLPIIRYEYGVGELKSTSNRIRPWRDDSFRRRGAEAKIAEYPEGAVVPVFYDPDDPHASCFEPGVFEWTAWLVLFVGIASTILLFGMLHAVITGSPFQWMVAS